MLPVGCFGGGVKIYSNSERSWRVWLHKSCSFVMLIKWSLLLLSLVREGGGIKKISSTLQQNKLSSNKSRNTKVGCGPNEPAGWLSSLMLHASNWRRDSVESGGRRGALWKCNWSSVKKKKKGATKAKECMTPLVSSVNVNPASRACRSSRKPLLRLVEVLRGLRLGTSN